MIFLSSHAKQGVITHIAPTTYALISGRYTFAWDRHQGEEGRKRTRRHRGGVRMLEWDTALFNSRGGHTSTELLCLLAPLNTVC